jgi:ABC-2 type transport system permease protein
MLHEAREATQAVQSKLEGMTGTPEKGPKAKDFADRVVEVQARLAKRSAPIMEAAHKERVKRQELMDALKFLSPAVVLQSAFEDIAGSGTARYEHFDSQADDFHEVYRGHFFDLIRAKKRIDKASFKALPTFRYAEESFTAVASRVALGMLVLLMLALGLLLVALPRFKRIGRLTN